MIKIITFTLIFVLMSVAWAENESLLKLKANHDAMIQKMGDVQFLKGTHYFWYSKNVPTSVYSIPKQKCIYAEANDRKYYRVIIANPGENKVSLSFTDKIVIGEKTHNLSYNISFIVSDKSGGCFVTLDQDNSDIIDSKADWSKILACILKYGEELYSAVKSCLKDPDIMECLKIIGPATDIYQCISGNALKSDAVADNREVVTRYISFSWQWNQYKPFPPAPVYEEMPYNIVSFDSLSFSYVENALGVVVVGSGIGNKLAKVEITQASFFPTYGSDVRGSIRCVMQK